MEKRVIVISRNTFNITFHQKYVRWLAFGFSAKHLK